MDDKLGIIANNFSEEKRVKEIPSPSYTTCISRFDTYLRPSRKGEREEREMSIAKYDLLALRGKEGGGIIYTIKSIPK